MMNMNKDNADAAETDDASRDFRRSRNMEYTEEDIVTINRCRQLSFWRGCVPLITGSVLAIAAAQNLGFFNNRPRLRVPSYLVGITFGYIAGKAMYANTCKQMFLDLRDSRIKDQLLRDSHRVGPVPDYPVILNTPVDKSNNERPRASYAERREFYRADLNGTLPSTPQTESPSDHVEGEESNAAPTRSSFFSDDRPLGSYQFDDVYRPRD